MRTEIWGHRGACAYAPENTLEAFELAAKMGADGVELDVQLTRDGEVVVIHDETIDRVCNGRGLVKEYTLEELKTFSVNRPHPEYADAKIPTLKEVYELLAPTGLKVNVELKTGYFFYPGIEEKVLEIAKEMNMEEKVWYSSFNHYSIKRIKELDPSAKIGILYGDGIYSPAEYAKWIGAEALHPASHNMQYPDYVKNCKEKNVKIHVWTVNDTEHIRQVINAGVDAVITNYPDRGVLVRDEEASVK